MMIITEMQAKQLIARVALFTCRDGMGNERVDSILTINFFFWTFLLANKRVNK